MQPSDDFKSWLNKLLGTGGEGAPDWMTSAGPDSPFFGRRALTVPEPPKFGGFQELPKGTDWEQFQLDLKKNAKLLATEVPNYEQNPMEVAFWDASIGHFRRVVADNQVIQMSLKDQTDALKQITGVFNVPAGGMVMIPFFGIQSGLVPSTYHGGGSGRAGDLSDMLSGETGGRDGRGKELRARERTTWPGRGVLAYGIEHGRNAEGDGSAELLRRTQGDSAAIRSAVDERSRSIRSTKNEAFMRHNEDRAQSTGHAPTGAININLHNTVVLSGKVIYDHMVHEMQSQMTRTRRGVGGGTGSQYLVG